MAYYHPNRTRGRLDNAHSYRVDFSKASNLLEQLFLLNLQLIFQSTDPLEASIAGAAQFTLAREHVSCDHTYFSLPAEFCARAILCAQKICMARETTNVIGTDLNTPVAYILLALQGETEITTLFFIPSILATSVRSDVVAVAVIANMITPCGTRLRISPILISACRNVSPLDTR